jgi:hypothetical protein
VRRVPTRRAFHVVALTSSFLEASVVVTPLFPFLLTSPRLLPSSFFPPPPSFPYGDTLCDLLIYVHLSCFLVASASTLAIYVAKRAALSHRPASYLHICPITPDLFPDAFESAVFAI